MGKTANHNRKDLLEEKDFKGIILPIKVPEDIIIQELFSGLFIAIYKGQIIAAEPSLSDLHDKCDELIPEGEGCLIDFVEESVGIYGFKV